MGIIGETIRNDDIRDKEGVVTVADKVRKVRLRWFRHVKTDRRGDA